MRVDLDGLLRLLREEQSLYIELEAQVDREMELVTSERIDELLSLLSEKQKIISQQENLQQKWRIISEALGVGEGRESPGFWSLVETAVGGQGYRELRLLVGDIREILNRVLEKEANVRDVLAEKIDVIRGRLSELTKNRGLMRSYALGRPVSGANYDGKT